MTRVLCPYPPTGPLGGLPESLGIDVWDGSGQLPPAAAEAEFYVMPYAFEPRHNEAIRHMPKLKVVQTQTAGYEHVLPYLRPGVTLCNARGVHDASTAELALALTLASLRGIPDFVRAQDQGKWADAIYPSLADRTVLILGYGSVGAAIDRRLLPFECEVLRIASRAREGVADLTALTEWLPRVDVVVIAVPLTAQTRGLVDADFLARMHDGALLVNVARGPVVDTAALLAELESGRLRAALDVTDPEPLPSDHPLWRAPGVLISPHVGGNTTAFLPRVYRLIRAQLERYAAGQPLDNVVVSG